MTHTLPLLSLTIFLPLLGAAAISLNWATTGNNSRWVALWTSLGVLALSLILWGKFDPTNPDFQIQETCMWIPLLKTTYHVGLDGISLPLVLLTALLIPLCILASWTSIQKRVAEFMIAFLVLETMLMGVFTSLDIFLFYLFFEGVLIPMFFIIGVWGGKDRISAAFTFFLYTLLGSVLMLIAILYIYHTVGDSSLLNAMMTAFDPEVQIWLWLAFFASFAVKIPMWPFHTWLPKAHVEAPTAGSIILAGVLLKMGGYGFLRFSIPLFPEASAFFTPLIFTLSSIAIVYTALVALVQTDMKRLIAYSSIGHMGFVTLGIFSASPQGMQGAVMQMVSHGLISAALFLCVGMLYERTKTYTIADFGGLAQRMTGYAIVFLFFILASLGLPGTSGFVAEFLVLVGTYQASLPATICASLALIFTAAYGLWLYKRVLLGPLTKPAFKKITDLDRREILMITPLVILVLLFGLYPTALLHIFEASISQLLDQYTLAVDPSIIEPKKSLDVAWVL